MLMMLLDDDVNAFADNDDHDDVFWQQDHKRGICEILPVAFSNY